MEAAPPSRPPTSTWREHVAVVLAPDGYGTAALLEELAGDGYPAVAVLDGTALASAAESVKDSEAGAAIKEFRSEHPDEPLPGRLIAPLLASRISNLREAGAAARDAAAAVGEADEKAEDGTAATASDPTSPSTGSSADAAPADAYYVLVNCATNAADFAPLASLGVGVDSAVWLAVPRGCIGIGNDDAAAEQQDDDSPHAEDPSEAAPKSDLAAGIQAAAGLADSGLEHCASVSLTMAHVSEGEATTGGWEVAAEVASGLVQLLAIMATKRAMYDEYTRACNVLSVPTTPEGPVDMRVYSAQASSAPLHAQSVPFLLDCLLAQVVHSAATEEEAAAYLVEEEISAIAQFLAGQDGALALESSAAQLAEEAACLAVQPRLVPSGDEVLAGALSLSPYCTASHPPTTDQALSRAVAVLEKLPIPGKRREMMPDVPALSVEERGIERTELHHFSRFSAQLVDQSMQLRALGALVDGADPHRCSQAQPPPSEAAGWLLADRPWEDELEKLELTQRITSLLSSSAKPEVLTTYHARDDALLVAMHTPVPDSRQSSSSKRSALYDKLFRPFGAWHDWLCQARPPTQIPPSPPLPDGRTLYRFSPSFDISVAEAPVTITSLYPSDHAVLRFSKDSGSLAIFCRDGSHVALSREPPSQADGSKAPPATLALSLTGGTRIFAGENEGGSYGIRVGCADGIELQLDCSGVTHLTSPAPDAPSRPRSLPSPPAVLKLHKMAAHNVPGNADPNGGTDPYLKMTLLEQPREEEVAAQTSTVTNVDSVAAWDDEKFLTLPASSQWPPLVRFDLWDKDWTNADDPLASAEVQLPEGKSGEVSSIVMVPADQGGESMPVELSFSYCVEASDPTSSVLSDPPSPPAHEVRRCVLPTGTVVRTMSDGSVQAVYPNANVSELRAAGDHEGCWVHTNAAGLRVGVKPTGEEFYMPPVAVASSTDPVSGLIATTRADGTLVLTRANGSRLITYADGTSLDIDAEAASQPDRGVIRVRAPGFPTISSNLRQKTVQLPTSDGAALSMSARSVHLSHPGGVQLQMLASGSAELLPAVLSVFDEPPDNGSGVYHFNLPEATFATKDPEGSTFKLWLDGRIQTDLVLKDELAGAIVEHGAPEKIGGGEEPEWSHPPRLFVCRPDGSGAELLRDADIALFEAIRKADATSSLTKEAVPSDPEATSHCHSWRSWHQLEAMRGQGPSEEDALLGFMPQLTEQRAARPLLFFRRLVRRQPMSVESRGLLEGEIREMEEWRQQEAARTKELHVTDTRTPAEIEAEAAVQRELMLAKAHPQHQAVDIHAALTSEQEKAADAFVVSEMSKRRARQRELEAAAASAVAEEEARLAAIEAARPRKSADAPSLNGAYQARLVRPVDFNGTGLSLTGTWSEEASQATRFEASPPVDTAAPSDGPESAPGATPSKGGGERINQGEAAVTAAATGATGEAGAEEQPEAAGGKADQLQGQTLTSMPTETRLGAVAASQPNLRSLLLEAPYKRGVRTVSMTQRLAEPSPAFRPAFELMPARADFGALRVGCLYRLPLRLINVTAVPQRFTIHGGAPPLKVVCKRGVAAPGMPVPLELEVGNDTEMELEATITVLTERESISLPVSASIVSAESLDAARAAPTDAPAPRLLSTTLRDPRLLKSYAPRPGDRDAGRLKGLAPERPEGGEVAGGGEDEDSD